MVFLSSHHIISPNSLKFPKLRQISIKIGIARGVGQRKRGAHHHKTSPPSPAHGYLSRAADTIFRSLGRGRGSNRGRWLDSEARMSWHGCGFRVECAQARCCGCWEVMLTSRGRRVKVGGENDTRSRAGFHVFGVFLGSSSYWNYCCMSRVSVVLLTVIQRLECRDIF